MSFFRCKEKNLPLGKKTYIMGILNVTPDSFFDGGKYINPEDAIYHAVQMQSDGADIIDVGAQSTRPGHVKISPQEEICRLEKVFPLLRKEIDVPISVDTYNVETARYVLDNGADIINDVSGMFNPLMAKTVKEYGAGWVLMHTGGGDSDTQKKYDDVVADVIAFFEDMLNNAKQYEIDLSSICLDVGFGFGKSKEDNIKLLKELNRIKFENAIMAGVSRKRFLQKDNDTAMGRLEATIKANADAIIGGVDILRVHDVAECAKSAAKMDAIYKGEEIWTKS